MKYSKVKNVIVTLLPVVLFFLYQIAQVYLRRYMQTRAIMLPYTLFNILVPAMIGVLFFLVIAYVYVNRNSLVFIALFCGAFLVNVLYSISFAGLLGTLTQQYLSMSAASQIAYVFVGAYIIGFWISLISYIKGRIKKSNQQGSVQYQNPGSY